LKLRDKDWNEGTTPAESQHFDVKGGWASTRMGDYLLVKKNA